MCTFCSADTAQSIWALRDYIWSSTIKIQQPCTEQFSRDGWNTIHSKGQISSCGLLYYSKSQVGTFFPLLKRWQSRSNRYPSNGVIPILRHAQNTTRSAHCNAGQSVWTVPRKFCYQCTARNECGEGGRWVDSGWRVLRGRELMWMVGWWPPAEAVWQRISLIPLQSKASFLWPVSPDVSENWRKKCSYENSFWSCWWELGRASHRAFLNTHTHTHTHTITSKVTAAILHFNRESWQDTVHEWGVKVDDKKSR